MPDLRALLGGLAACAFASFAFAQSREAAPVPVAKAEARVTFAASLDEVPETRIVLPPVDPAEIEIVR
jgi:hypothetical protein